MDISYYKSFEPIDGKWYITRELGRGAFGRVFEVERHDFGENMKSAMKVVSVPASPTDVSSYREENFDLDEKSVTSYFYGFVEEFVKEFQLMHKLRGHSNIVSYEDHTVKRREGEIGWDIFIRMELLTPVSKYFAENTITKKDIIRLGIDICKALEVCQKNNIVHRDIKPSNIFVSDNGDFKLGDFGVARTLEKTSSALSIKGTYTYMAPEVFKGGNDYDTRVDIYSLGIVMYRLLNNNMEPFRVDRGHGGEEEALAKRMRGEKIPKPVNADDRLAEIVLKACSFDMADRYNSATEMRRDLEGELLKIGVVSDAADNKAKTHGADVQPLTDGTEETPEALRNVGVDDDERTVGIFDDIRVDSDDECTVGAFDDIRVDSGDESTVGAFDDIRVDSGDESTVGAFDDISVDSGDESTVGILDSTEAADDDEKTVGIDSDKDSHEVRNDKPGKKKKLLIPIILIAIVVFILTVAALSVVTVRGKLVNRVPQSVEMETEMTVDILTEVYSAGFMEGNVMLSVELDTSKLQGLCDVKEGEDKITLTALSAGKGQLGVSVNGSEIRWIDVTVYEKIDKTELAQMFATEETIFASIEADTEVNKELIASEMQTVRDIVNSYGDIKTLIADATAPDLVEYKTLFETSMKPAMDTLWVAYVAAKGETLEKCPVCGSTEHITHPKTSKTPKPSISTKKCPVCGSTAHTTHPCDYCGSVNHSTAGHPLCPACGSASHTTHPTGTCSICGSSAHYTSGHRSCGICGDIYHTSAEHPRCSICGTTAHPTNMHIDPF